METTTAIFEKGLELGLTPLNLVLVVMVYFMGAKTGIFPKFWGKEEPSEKPATQASMDKLSNYYNHDTTAILRSIDEGVHKVHEAVESLEDKINELHVTHAEWEKYGIPIRGKKQ